MNTQVINRFTDYCAVERGLPVRTISSYESDPALTLEHAIVHVWRQAKLAQSCEEHEDFAIALKLLGLLRDGWSSGNPFNLACGYAVGLCHVRYLRRRAERAESMRLEFARCIPDYDASTEEPIEHDPTDGRRHYGNQFLKKYIRGHGWQGNGRQPDIAPLIAFIEGLSGSTKDLGKLPIGPIPNTKKDTALKLARIEQTRKAVLSAWSESARANRKWTLAENVAKKEQRLAADVGKKLLDSVSDYLYGEAQTARNAFERDSYTLALSLIAAARRGEPDPFLYASYAAFGGFPMYVQRRADWQWLAHQEFMWALPQEKKSGHKLLTMASSNVARTDPRATGEANPSASRTRERLGNLANADCGEFASLIPWPESPGVGDIASG